uniref:Putative diaminopimelate decarboxylase n=1 Tax=Sphaerisporangium sp. SANK 60911 TaxID=1354075 RepID=V5YTA6_9ACTN|nr:putative diaminopimelate decarboxylase [Sphaerisporangium sp. SANK 60911]
MRIRSGTGGRGPMSAWQRFETTVATLRADAERPDAKAVEGEPGWLPLETPLPARVRAAAEALPRTPALLWDLEGLRRHALHLVEVFGAYGIDVNLAMKSCSSVEVVRTLAELGLGADAASVYELEWAREAGFREISACGPGFTVADLPALRATGALLDAVSVRQARAMLSAPGTRRLGLRLRVPMPPALVSPTTKGRDSRFGVELTEDLADELRSGPAKISRLRVHTGESTSLTLGFRAAYALACARLLGGVDALNLGGGFLRLARRPKALEEALLQLAPLFEEPAAEGERYRVTVEPGGALVADHAYLVTDVLDVEEHPSRGRLVTVDASAWNVAPWSKVTFHVLGGAAGSEPATIAGPSLYELDMFTHRSDEGRYRFPLGRCAPGDRLVGTSVGSYTMTNGRSFHGLPLPAQYAVAGPEPSLLHGPFSYVEQGAAAR